MGSAGATGRSSSGGKRRRIAWWRSCTKSKQNCASECTSRLPTSVHGYYRYHAVPGNIARLSVFGQRLRRLWRLILRRRSQRPTSWNRTTRILQHLVDLLRICVPNLLAIEFFRPVSAFRFLHRAVSLALELDYERSACHKEPRFRLREQLLRLVTEWAVL